MKILKEPEKTRMENTWEQQSGFLAFLSSVPSEVTRFNDNFGFGIEYLTGGPAGRDGVIQLPVSTGFLIVRSNPLLPESTYCLYTVLTQRVLYSYIGLYREGTIRTVKELAPLKDFAKGKSMLYEWMRQLVRASCEKMTL